MICLNGIKQFSTHKSSMQLLWIDWDLIASFRPPHWNLMTESSLLKSWYVILGQE